jgi:mannose-6-phosphate isomerase-like protein (cupin superfamily)
MAEPVNTNTYSGGQSDRRPWGDWLVLDAGPGFVVKRIRIIPGGILSLQRHRHRAEVWTIVAGKARATLGTRQFDLGPGEFTSIPTGEIHRIANPGDQEVVFIEVQTGPILSEDDIERLEDSYGRT